MARKIEVSTPSLVGGTTRSFEGAPPGARMVHVILRDRSTTFVVASGDHHHSSLVVRRFVEEIGG